MKEWIKEQNFSKIKFPHDPLTGFIPASFRWESDPNNPPPPPPPAQTILAGEDIPEAFRGKSAKEVIDQLISTSTEIERIKTESTKKDQELATLKSTTRIEPPPSQLSAEEIEVQKEREFFQKPLKVLSAHIDEKLKPFTEGIEKEKINLYGRLAETTKEGMKVKKKDFSKYEKRIDEYVSSVPIEFRAHEKTWETAYNLARSEDLDNREKEFNAKAGLHVETGGGGEPPKPTKRVLDAEEKRVAAQYGMSDDEYVKWSENYYGD